MQVGQLGKSPGSTSLNTSEQSSEEGTFSGMNIALLPDDVLQVIFSNLGVTDISVCRFVNRWRTVIDDNHLLEYSFYRECCASHQVIPPTVERYHSSIRDWLTRFSKKGKELTEQLDKILETKHFTVRLFSSIAELLQNANKLTCQNITTIAHSHGVNSAGFSPDGNHLVTASDDQYARIWQLVDGEWRNKKGLHHLGVDSLHHPPVKNASFSPDGNHLMTTLNRSVHIWRLVDDQWQKKATICHSKWVSNASFSPDGSHLVTASHDRTAKIWGLVGDQWQEKTTIHHSAWVNDAIFSPDGNHLVTASEDQTAQIWGLFQDGKWRRQQKATIRHTSCVKYARFSPDGHHVTTVDCISFTVWKLANDGQWQEKATTRFSQYLRDVMFSPVGKHLVTDSSEGIAKIWKFVDGQWQEKATIESSSFWLTSASFSPDGNHLVVTVDRDKTAKIWGLVQNGEWQLKAIIQHSEKVLDAKFCPDGIHLVTASSDRTARIWMLKSEENDDIS